MEAKKSKLISNIVVSTDSNEIASISKQYGAEVPFIRPKEFSYDNSLTYDVVKHCVDFLNAKQDIYDIILLLQPTTPFRPFSSIDRAIEILLNDKSFDSIWTPKIHLFMNENKYKGGPLCWVIKK